MIEITLPWPSSALRPNAASPGNWRKKATAAKAYKAHCLAICRYLGLRKVDGDVRPHLTIVFMPPDRRRRDLDNLLAQFKHGIDAISETLEIDDYLFSYSIRRGQPVPSGRVEVTITEGE